MSSRHSIEHIFKKIPKCQMMFFFFWFWLSIVCHTEDKICLLLLLGRYDASPKLMQLSADDLKSLGTWKNASMFTNPSKFPIALSDRLSSWSWLASFWELLGGTSGWWPCWSNSTRAQYVNWMKKSQHMRLWLHKLVLSQHFYKVCYTMLTPSPLLFQRLIVYGCSFC